MSFTTSEYEGAANGTLTAAAPTDRSIVINLHQPTGASHPRASVRSVWVPLAEDGDYSDHQVLVKTRYPERVGAELSSGDFGRMREGLRHVVLEHNGWLDPDSGEPLPPADQACAVAHDEKEAIAAEQARRNEEMASVGSLVRAKDEDERTYNDRLKVARDRVALESQRRLARIQEEAAARTQEQPWCCYWHSLSQPEILLILRAVTGEQKKVFASLLATKSN